MTFTGGGGLEVKPTVADLFASPNLRARVSASGRNTEKFTRPGFSNPRGSAQAAPLLEYRAENDFLLPSKNRIGDGLGYTGPREGEASKGLKAATLEHAGAPRSKVGAKTGAGNHIFEKNLQDERGLDMNTRDMLERYARDAFRLTTKRPPSASSAAKEELRGAGVGLSKINFESAVPSLVLEAALGSISPLSTPKALPSTANWGGLLSPNPSDTFSDYSLRGYSEKL